MRIFFLTKSKPYTCGLLRWMIRNHIVVGVIGKDRNALKATEMERVCLHHNVPIFSIDEVYEKISNRNMPGADIAVSNNFGRLIKPKLIDYVRGNIFNLHGAILPDYKGLFVYNHGILNEEKEWGVTAHFVNERFDEGDIIEIRRFKIDHKKITIGELENLSQRHAFEMTRDIITAWEERGKPIGVRQTGGGTYFSRDDFERAKEIKVSDTATEVRKKIQAFYYPPYEGAFIVIGGERFELMVKR